VSHPTRKIRRKKEKEMIPMRTEELIRYGIPSRIVDVWEETGLTTLLPVQAKAVKDFGLFESGNLIVSAPTSSGKTFIGEMAAVKFAMETKKAIYCVPLKALAEEKYLEFRRKYEKCGLGIAISTRDRREHDEAINSGDFSIAIVVYEKLQQLITQNLGVLDDIGIIIIDELQMLSDDSRGAELELLLTKLKMYPGKYKILGLSAVLKNCHVIPDWLGAKFLEFFQRPVELRRGILYKGTFHYEEHNTGSSGEEELLNAEGDFLDVIMANAAHLAARGEQCLVFLKDKNSTRCAASTLAEKMKIPAAQKAIEELSHIEDTSSKFQLIECLEKGVAFHNADMNIEEREVVERHFRAGNIMALCSTSTLAMGVNLPARNVFLETNKWYTNRRVNRPYTSHITKSEFDNMGGRAGRYSIENQFGRAIIVADTEFEYLAWRRKYIEGEIEELETRLFDSDLGTIVLNLVASGICRDVGEVKDFIKNSLSWFKDSDKKSIPADEFDAKIMNEIERCMKHGLFEPEGDGIVASKMGLACAAKGISLDSSLMLITWLRHIKDRPAGDLETLYAAARTPDARDYHMNMSTQEYRETPYHSMLERDLDPAARKLFSKVFDDPLTRTYERIKMMKVALVMNEWITDTPLVDIESGYNTWSGTIQRVAEGMSWIVDAVAGIAAAMVMGDTRVKQFERLSKRLLHGIDAKGIPLASLHVKGLTRHQITKLLAAGIANVESLKTISQDDLAKIIPARLARRVLRKIGMMESVKTKTRAAQKDLKARVPTARKSPEPGHTDKRPAKKSSFRCADKLHFDGRADKRRTYILLNGKEISVPNREFEILLHFAVQLKKDGEGWVHGEKFAPDSVWQNVSRLRKGVKPYLLDENSDFIENNGGGAYRLSIPPGNVTFDADVLGAHWNRSFAELVRQVEPAAM